MREKRPNILFLMVDQMQGAALKSDMCHTPNLDRLAERGILFKNAYTPNAVCSPARASLMTGLLPHNHGVLHVIHIVDDDQSCIRADKTHWAQRLNRAGYSTAFVGKWHVERKGNLKEFGWDTYVHEEKAKPNLIKTRYIKDMEGYPHSLLYGITDTLPEQRPVGLHTSHALKLMEDLSENDEPWCLFVSTNEPHDPFVCGKEAYDMYNPEEIELPASAYDTLEGKPGLYKKAARAFDDLTEREKKEAMACYYASITEIDAQYGRLLSRLEELGAEDDTVVIFTSDHGELLGEHRLYQKNISAFESAYNIPLIMAGAGISGRGECKARVGLHDLCQTILDAAGCDTINTSDSKSFAALLDAPQEVSEEWMRGYAEYFGGRILLTQRVIWDGKYKYVFNGFDEDELYNLEEDLYELKNLISDTQYKDTIKHMIKFMWDKVKATGDHSLKNTFYASLRLAPYGSDIK